MGVLTADRVVMSQKARDVLKALHAVQEGQRTQAEAARLLDLSANQVRRIQRRLEAEGAGGWRTGCAAGLPTTPRRQAPPPRPAGLRQGLPRLRPHLRRRR